MDDGRARFARPRASDVARAFGLALSLLCAARASAGSLTISPLQIDLNERARSEILTLTNASDRPVDVLVSGHRWAQNANASQQLTEAPELVVYPTSFTLAALETRPIRIALPQPDRSHEGDYRILVTELPPQERAGGAGLQLREQLSIPAFAAVVNPTIALHIVSGRVAEGSVSFDVRNAGSGHTFVERADIELLDANANLLERTTVNGWYVLPGAEQTYRATVGAGICARVATLRLRVHGRSGEDLFETIKPQQSCARTS
jgi:P pilus assembly chaperone PapD